MERNFIVTLSRFHRHDPGMYIVQGYFQGNSIAGNRMRAFADGKELKVTIGHREGLAIRQKYFAMGMGNENIDREYDLLITLPGEGESFRVLKVYQYLNDERRLVLRTTRKRLEAERKIPDGYLETWHDDGDRIRVGGWTVCGSPVRIQVQAGGEKIKSRVSWHYRQDIVENYPELDQEEKPENKSFGYEVAFDRPKTDRVTMILAADGQKQTYNFSIRRGTKNVTGYGLVTLKKALKYYRRNGFTRTLRKVLDKIREKTLGRSESYDVWRRRNEPSREELAVQERNVFLHEPLISIVVPLYKTDEKMLRALIASIQAQTYKKWELCLSDGSGAPSPLTDLLRQFEEIDSRIRVVSSPEALGISDNTNAAIGISKGEYIIFADHDDLLPPNALYECAKVINAEPEADLVYSDEDKVSMDGKTYFEPHFKTDFNIDLLCSMNYFCHLVMVKKSLLDETGLLRSEFDGAQDYDLVLRCAEKAKKICHIPKVLYHWRSHQDSTAENPASKMYAFEAGRKAVQAHFDRIGVKTEVEMGEYPGLYRVQYVMPDQRPMISIIIPNKDHIQDLDKCVRSIRENSTYPNYEFVIVENNSVDEGTFEYYRSMEQQYENFHTVYWDHEFNYSNINNFGVEHAKGDFYLFLNNDTSVISRDWMEQMIGPLLRPEAGISGARLYYPDDTIQHAGVIIGYGGIAGHAFQGQSRTDNGYFSRIICSSDLSAVTAACMLVKKEAFEKAGGFDGALRVAFNDVDFCLKVREAGYLVVYCPYAELYHYESKSRGYEDTPEKIARFNSEADVFLKKWPHILKNGDPYYNPNLTLDKSDFSLKP